MWLHCSRQLTGQMEVDGGSLIVISFCIPDKSHLPADLCNIRRLARSKAWLSQPSKCFEIRFARMVRWLRFSWSLASQIRNECLSPWIHPSSEWSCLCEGWWATWKSTFKLPPTQWQLTMPPCCRRRNGTQAWELCSLVLWKKTEWESVSIFFGCDVAQESWVMSHNSPPLRHLHAFAVYINLHAWISFLQGANSISGGALPSEKMTSASSVAPASTLDIELG